MSRKLVIDGQIFQTPAWHRGMGKYSLELLASIASQGKTKTWTSIELILSKNLTQQPKSSIAHRIPGITTSSLDLRPNNFRNPKIAEHNKRVIDQHLSSQTNKGKTDYLILSLMQREIYPVFPSEVSINKLLLIYDLVPLMFHNLYLNSPVTQAEYLSKIAELQRADHYFTISKTVANDLALYLGVPKQMITSIDGGPIPHGRDVKPVDVPEPFILMPTGNDPRKNNRRGILGFEEFNKLHDGKYSLVITSFFKAAEKKDFSKLSSSLHFTGNISGEELHFLYSRSAAVLFPSEYEGLGLPILEAIDQDKPVACSNIAVFREMSKTAFHYFEPKSVLGIERALGEAVEQTLPSQQYIEIRKKYTWDNTAQAIADTVGRISRPKAAASKNQVAVLCPALDVKGGYSRLMLDCHFEMRRRFDVTYYMTATADENTNKHPRINYLPFVAKTSKIVPGFSFAPETYGDIIYQIENNENCAEVMMAALAAPGTVLLYELELGKVWQSMVRKKLISQKRLDLEVSLNKKFAVPGASLLASLIYKQKQVVVFNPGHAKIIVKLATQIGSSARVSVADLPMPALPYPEALADKTIEIGEINNGTLSTNFKPFKTKTDAQYDEILSKMKTVILDNMSRNYDVMSALRFGVVPFVPAQLSSLADGIRVRAYTNVKTARLDARDANLSEHNAQDLASDKTQAASKLIDLLGSAVKDRSK